MLGGAGAGDVGGAGTTPGAASIRGGVAAGVGVGVGAGVSIGVGVGVGANVGIGVGVGLDVGLAEEDADGLSSRMLCFFVSTGCAAFVGSAGVRGAGVGVVMGVRDTLAPTGITATSG